LIASAVIAGSVKAHFFVCQNVRNISVGHDDTVWGMMSPSQSDHVDEELMTDRPQEKL